jgi:ribosomal protein S18 acetylase RimI-like enzyme
LGDRSRVLIRRFEFDRDYDQAHRLWGDAGPGIHLSPSDEPKEIQKKLERDPDMFLVAESGGKLVGTVLGGFDGRRGIVYHLAVDRALRRQGIGRRLMEAVELRLKAKGCRKYYLLVTHDNPEAVAFYQDLGCDLMPLYVLGKEIR